MVDGGRRSTYLRVLAAQTRRLGDYEQVHFRKSWAQKTYETISLNQVDYGTSPSHTSRPILQPQVHQFSKATAKTYLKKTEPLWLKLDLSRQEATNELFDRKTGSFFVRASSRAKYALSVRLDDKETPVMHYLIYCNSQNFYGIQGSNLQFVTLYDLLAFFCFQQSGGMPCYLVPPALQSHFSDSEESESEGEDDELFSSEMDDTEHGDSKKQLFSELYQHRGPNNKGPPPVPPRRKPLFDHLQQFDQVEHGDLQAISRVSSLVDSDRGALFDTLKRQKNSNIDQPVKTRQEITPATPTVEKHREETTPPEITRSYKNFQILKEHAQNVHRNNPSSILLQRPISELPLRPHPPPLPPRVERVFDATPPAIPPKPVPPPIPPRVRRSTDEPPPDEIQSPFRGHRRAASDSSIVSGLSEEPVQSPPPIPPKQRYNRDLTHVNVTEKEEESKKEEVSKETDKEIEGWTFIEQSEEFFPSPVTSSSSTPAKHHHKWKKPRWAKKLNKAVKWRRKPRSRVKHYILDLADDKSTEFGARVHYFLEALLMKSAEPHQKLLSDVRQFLSRMREVILDNYRVELLSHGMDSCNNFEHLLEATLQQCITQPLHKFLYSKLEEYMTSTGSLTQLKGAVDNAKNKTPEELGIRAHLMVPTEKSLQEISSIFDKLKKTFCAMRKLEYLLEAVRLTYEGVKDINNLKKSMNDLGADDFLPLFVWVLAHTGFVTAEIEAEYIWGLAHPSLFNGEGGYYLTTLTSAVNVLRELCGDEDEENSSQQRHKNMNCLKTELQIHIENQEIPGQFTGPYSFPVLPTMTVAEICDMIADRFKITDPENYALCTYVGGKATKLDMADCPQEININWELESYDGTERFLAYMVDVMVTKL